MKNLERLEPIHINIRVLWMRRAREIAQGERVAEEILRLQNAWRELAEMKRDDSSHDQDAKDEEFELDMHIGRVKVFDWCWLTKQFDGCDLGRLQLAICEQEFPDKAWELLMDDEHAVVTDRDRFFVCDMKLCDQLSAAASLVLAGDPTYAKDTRTLQELIGFRKQRIAMFERAKAQIEADLQRFAQKGSVSALRPE